MFHLKRTLISFDFCISTPILNLQVTMCMTCNCDRHWILIAIAIQWQKSFVKSQALTMGQHTFYFSGIRHDLVIRMYSGMTSVMTSEDLRYSLLYLLHLRSNGSETLSEDLCDSQLLITR